MFLCAMLSHKHSFVCEQQRNMLHPRGALDMSKSFSELSLVLQYQGGLVLRGRKGVKGPCSPPSLCVGDYSTGLSLCHGQGLTVISD